MRAWGRVSPQRAAGLRWESLVPLWKSAQASVAGAEGGREGGHSRIGGSWRVSWPREWLCLVLGGSCFLYRRLCLYITHPVSFTPRIHRSPFHLPGSHFAPAAITSSTDHGNLAKQGPRLLPLAPHPPAHCVHVIPPNAQLPP